MTLTEFYTELTKTKDKLAWGINEDGKIRGIQWRGMYSLAFCPLNAVLYFKEQMYLENHLFFPTVQYLGITVDDGVDIVLAADNAVNMDQEIRRKLEEVLI